jgi:hypothetical protein
VVSISADSVEWRVTREPSGMPSRYLSVSIPWARGEKTMQPSPSSASVSSSSASIQRFSIEYEGWLMRNGVLSSRRMAAATRVFVAEYEDTPT